jgi:hypothetical protein
MTYLPIVLFVMTILILLTARRINFLNGIFEARVPGSGPRSPRQSMLLILLGVLCMAILICALYILYSNSFDKQQRAWAYGAFAAVIGFALGRLK